MEPSGFTSQLDAALRYAEHGWPVFPCGANKKPLLSKDDGGNGFLDATTNPKQIVAWWRQYPQAQIGVATEAARLCVVDLDLKPEEQLDGVASWSRLKDEHGADHCGLIASTPRGGRHYVYRAPESGSVISGSNIIPRSGIDVRAKGAYVVVPSPGSPGREWMAGDPFEPTDICTMPGWVWELVTRNRSGRDRTDGPPGFSGATGGGGVLESGAVLPIDAIQLERIRSALDWIENDSRESWIRVGMALKSTGAGTQALELWVEWSKRTASGAVHPKFDHQTQMAQWRSIHEFRFDGSEVTIASLFHMAQQAGWIPATPIDDVIPSLADLPTSAVVAAADVADMPKVEAPRPFPRDLINCPGLVGEIAAWMIANSTRPQPALCLASTLTMLGAVLGRRVSTPTDLRTNLYTLGIGETGCGKDPSVKLPQVLLAHAGLARFVGPGEWKSDSGLRSALVAEPSHVCLVDEFTKMLAAMSGRQVPPHILGIKSCLLRLFPLANGVYLAPAYADRRMHPPVEIGEPNLCVYGTGVPSELFASLDRGAVSDGFLNRFLVFLADDQAPPRQKVARQPPPAGMLATVRALEESTRPSGLAGSGSSVSIASGCRIVPHDESAAALIAAMEAEIDVRVAALRERREPMVDLWLRFVEHVLKVALIRTAADDPKRATTAADVQWAHDLVLWCTERTIGIAEDRVSDSQHEANLKRVLRVIREAGAVGITASVLTRRTQWLKTLDRTDILKTLVHGGQVLCLETASSEPGRKPVTYRALA